MIYNTRNQSNDTTESQKRKKLVIMLICSSQSKMSGLNKMWSLKRLAMLKYECRTSQHAIKFK